MCARDPAESSTVAAAKPLLFSASSHTTWPQFHSWNFPKLVPAGGLHAGCSWVTFLSQGPLTTEARRRASGLCSKSTLCIYLGSGRHKWQSGIRRKAICLRSFPLGDCQSCEERAWADCRAGAPPHCSQPATTASLPFSCIGTKQLPSTTFPPNLGLVIPASRLGL